MKPVSVYPFLCRISGCTKMVPNLWLYCAKPPGSEKVQSLLAWQLAARVLDQMTDSAASDLARADMLADRALTVFPRTAVAHYAKAQVLRAQ
jgi:hypothetical protein